MRSASSDKVFIALVAALVVLGLAVLSSATGPIAYAKFNSSFWFVQHQILYGLLPGILLFLIFYRIPYGRFQRLAFPLLLLTIGLLAVVFIPGLGAPWGRTQSWISLFGFSLQPSEIAKLTFILYLAAWLVRRNGQERGIAGSLPAFIAVLIIVVGLLAAQPDIGTLAIVSAIAVAMYFVAGAPLLHLAGIAAAGVAGLVVLVKAAPYRAARLLTFLHPEQDPQGVGYHINQALIAIGSGGFWGLGYGRSRQKFLYLPEVAGDSIFAVVGEELGFVFSTLFILLFAALVWRGLSIAARAPDRFGALVATGIVAWFGLQAVVNIGSMVGLLPLTGLTLPLVSYGGTSLAASLAAAGIMANISKRV